MGFFDKIKRGLKKTSDAVSDYLPGSIKHYELVKEG